MLLTNAGMVRMGQMRRMDSLQECAGSLLNSSKLYSQYIVKGQYNVTLSNTSLSYPIISFLSRGKCVQTISELLCIKHIDRNAFSVELEIL